MSNKAIVTTVIIAILLVVLFTNPMGLLLVFGGLALPVILIVALEVIESRKHNKETR